MGDFFVDSLLQWQVGVYERLVLGRLVSDGTVNRLFRSLKHGFARYLDVLAKEQGFPSRSRVEDLPVGT